MLPEPQDCNFIKKSSIQANGRTEMVLVYRLKGSEDFNILFVCPSCGKNSEISGSLNVKKYKEGSKKKEGYYFVCQGCSAEFCVEKFKSGRGSPASRV